MQKQLLEKIAAREACVGITGLGYVGLPLLMEFAKQSFKVIGFDVDEAKITALRNGKSYIRHLPDSLIKERIFDNPEASVTSDFASIGDCDAILICVPTPLTKHRDPDLSFIEKTAAQMAPHLKPGQLIVLESTTYPGTTEEVLVPILESCGLKAGPDLMVAYSPEREDPNNREYQTASIPKVVGGLTPDSLTVAQALYDAIICKTVPVSSCRAAEATKLMENIFRCINIALVNELKTVFTEMDIDIWEVIHAASTKPFGFMPFYPGPGLGGHCIPIDPFYLTWKAKEFGISTRFIELAGEVNTAMPQYVIQRTMLALNERGKPIKGSRILLIGLAYKKNVDDDRESPTYVLWESLQALGAEVHYFDPYCAVVRPTREHPQFAGLRSITEDAINHDFDAAIIATAHDCVDHDKLAARLQLVVDTRGVCAPALNVVKA